MVQGRTPASNAWARIAPGEAASAVLLFRVPVNTGPDLRAATETDWYWSWWENTPSAWVSRGLAPWDKCRPGLWICSRTGRSGPSPRGGTHCPHLITSDLDAAQHWAANVAGIRPRPGLLGWVASSSWALFNIRHCSLEAFSFQTSALCGLRAPHAGHLCVSHCPGFTHGEVPPIILARGGGAYTQA